METKSKKVLYNMIIIALFTALTYVGTYINIPVGTSKVHLGNFVCILAGLLCGGLVGGIAGSVGMGLSDIFYPYGPDTFIRTFIVKFILGFIAGTLFRYLVKKEKKITYLFYVLSSLFLILFITFITLYFVNGSVIPIGERKFTISILLIVLVGIMSVFFLIIQIFVNKFNQIQQYVLFVASVASVINIILEFLIKIPLKAFMTSMTWEQAFIYAVASLPSAIITCIITTLGVTIIYLPLYSATKRINKLNDLYDSIQRITSIDSNDEEETTIKENTPTEM